MIRVHFMCAAIQQSSEKASDDEDSHVACDATLDRLPTLDCRNLGIFKGDVPLSGVLSLYRVGSVI